VGNPIKEHVYYSRHGTAMLGRKLPRPGNRFEATANTRQPTFPASDNSPPKIGQIVSRRRNSYVEKIPELEPIFCYLARKRVPRGAVSEIAGDTLIPIDTLYDWRRKLKKNSIWRPGLLKSISHRALTYEQEELIASVIRTEFIATGLYCPPRYLNILALRIAHDAGRTRTATPDMDRENYTQRRRRDSTDEDDFLQELDSLDACDESSDDELTDNGEPPSSDESRAGKRTDPEAAWGEEITFRASNHWRQAFMERWGFSLRKPHPRRRPVVDDAKRLQFLDTMREILETTPPWLVLNTDETSWKLLNHSFLTIAQRGEETISCLFDRDPKACITAIATIDAAGRKLPLWAIAKGKTERSERRMREHCRAEIAREDLIVSHQESGWTGRDVALQFLHWLADRYRRPIVLVWDLFSAHRDREVQETAGRLGIRLIFIPPGLTGECQPLDRRVFGNLKQRARRRFDNEVLQGRSERFCLGSALRLLVEVWRLITQDEILGAWDHLRPGEEN
jgi:hypothetical protein